MGSLKDELMKAGLKATQAAKAPSAANEREVIKKKKLTEAIVHQEQRNFFSCMICKFFQIDLVLT